MFSRITKKSRHAFTLVEIMIVVLIIGILLAMAIPNFVRARETSRAKACQSNLKQINGAEEQIALEMNLPQGYPAPPPGALSPAYIKVFPSCPSNGTYTTGIIGTFPTCTIGAQQGYNDHVLP